MLVVKPTGFGQPNLGEFAGISCAEASTAEGMQRTIKWWKNHVACGTGIWIQAQQHRQWARDHRIGIIQLAHARGQNFDFQDGTKTNDYVTFNYGPDGTTVVDPSHVVDGRRVATLTDEAVARIGESGMPLSRFMRDYNQQQILAYREARGIRTSEEPASGEGVTIRTPSPVLPTTFLLNQGGATGPSTAVTGREFPAWGWALVGLGGVVLVGGVIVGVSRWRRKKAAA